MYRINENLSKEENLELAKAYTEKASELLARFKDIVAEANKQFPGATFGLSKARLEKHKSPNEAYQRVVDATRSAYNTKSTYEMRERIAKEKADKEAQAEKIKQIEAEATVDAVNAVISKAHQNQPPPRPPGPPAARRKCRPCTDMYRHVLPCTILCTAHLGWCGDCRG